MTNAEAAKRYRLRWPDRIKAYRKKYRKKIAAYLRKRKSTPTGWAKSVLPHLKFRANKLGLAFNIKAEDIKVPTVCPVFGTKLTYGNKQSSAFMPNNPSVDRVDNTKGYIKGNIAVISLRANLLKKDASLAELKLLVKYMENHIDHNSL